MRYKGKLRLLLVLLAALGLRLINLDQSLWLDEAIEWWAVKSFGLRELLTGYMAGDFNPPGHHVLMWFWVRFFGDSEIALRMPSVIFGVGIVWWVYRIASLLRSDLGVRQGRTLIERFFPELAAGMAAVNGLLIYYSQEARMYAMAAFFAAGAMYWFMKINKTNKTDKTNGTDYAIYCLFLAGAMYSHYLTWLLLPFLAIWGVRYLAPLLVTIPWWLMLVKQLSAGMAAAGNPVWAELSQTNFKNLGLVAVKFVTGRVPWPDGWGQLGAGVIVFGFWMIIFIGVIRVISPSTRLTLRRRPPASRSQRASVRGSDVTADFLLEKIRSHPKAIWLVILLWAGGPLLLGAVIGLFMPVFTYFRFLFVVPAVMILAAKGNERLAPAVRSPFPWSTSTRRGVATAGFGRASGFLLRKNSGPSEKLGRLGILGGLGIFSLVYLFNPEFHREDWRGAVGELRRQEEVAVVLIHPAVKPPFDYYDRDKSIVVERSNLAAARLDLMNPSIWYIPYAQQIFDPQDSVRKELGNLGYIRDYERHFRGVTLERWTSADSIAEFVN